MQNATLVLDNYKKVVVYYTVEEATKGDNETPPTPQEINIQRVYMENDKQQLDFLTLNYLGIIDQLAENLNEILNG